MTPHLVVDLGNSRMKWGRVIGGGVRDWVSLPHDDTQAWAQQWAKWPVSQPRVAVVSVHPQAFEQFQVWLHFQRATTLHLEKPEQFPLAVRVTPPEQVGRDRLANAVAAHRLQPEQPVVVVSVGTAMVIDAIDAEGAFRGGAILPGPTLMARSLHAFTAKLPLVPAVSVPPDRLPGTNTVDAISAGIRAALVGALREALRDLTPVFGERPHLLMTGGGVGDLLHEDFSDQTRSQQARPQLTLEGVLWSAESQT